jgi:uncharacterized membrane-anchored protein
MMEQFYFLSIVFNGLAGFLFVFEDSRADNSAENNRKLSVIGDGFRLILGILAAITGILKLLLPMGGIPILGDLVPALAGIAAGFILIYSFYRERSAESIDDNQEKINHLGEIFLHHRKTTGIILLASAVLHFLFPRAFFL